MEIYQEPWDGVARTGFIDEGRGLTWAQFATGLVERADLRDELTRALRIAPHDGLFWECGPVSRDTTDRLFECVLAPSNALARIQPRPAPFAQQLDPGAGTEQVRTFGNIGGDAVLTAPCRPTPDADYAHLLRFVRTAPDAQIHGLWAEVGRNITRWWAERDTPVWVSTSGLGVHWLHVRLDERPKYITWAPYRKFP